MKSEEMFRACVSAKNPMVPLISKKSFITIPVFGTRKKSVLLFFIFEM